jgi:histidine triad (HIT) family protein
MTQEKTIFEKIVAGEIPSHKVYEDNDTFAFLEIQPHSAGHTLVIPKKPYENIHELPEDIAQKLILSVQKVANAIKKATNADGIKLMMHNGKAAGQIVFHAHIHIIPRFENDQWPKKYEYSDGEAESVAEKIRQEISE